MSPKSFTGRGRRRTTRQSVLLAERGARLLISIGGIGTILAVSLILVFLLWVVAPLFSRADFEQRPGQDLAGATPAAPLAVGTDEYQVLTWAFSADGVLRAWRLDTGELLREERPFGARLPTAVSQPDGGGHRAFGFDDGTVRLARFDFSATFVDPAEDPALVAAVGTAERATWHGAVVQHTPEGQYRRQTLEVTVEEPLDLGARSAIVALDALHGDDVTRVIAFEAAGRLRIADVERSENDFTGEVTRSLALHEVEWHPRPDGAPPAWVLIAGAGNELLVAWKDGQLRRYDAREVERAVLAEGADLVDGEGTLEAVAFLIGRSTLVTGDSRGRVRAWFGTKPPDAGTSDGIRLVPTHDLALQGAPVRALSTSQRTRTVAAGSADGRVALYYVTSHKDLLVASTPDGAAVEALVFAPKDDGLVALAGGQLASWRMDLLHPEASLSALFLPVWYEGYPSPEHVWQSSSGTDDFEAKLGLWPLVFGTLKSTAYSMLFGVPLAILAAIYTSEFLNPRLRTPLKSAVELMASLPSVVLGFLAAILFAPYVQGVVPEVLAAFFAIPFALLLGARLWSLLPPRAYVRLAGTPRFLAIGAMVPLGLLGAAVVGPWLERAFFAGDIGAWLHGGAGRAAGGWLLLLLPLCALAVALVGTRVVDPWWRRLSHGWSREQGGRMELARFAAGALLTVGLTLALSFGLDGAGFDPRGGVFDTYVQRNALIVGVVMGFAIVPIIYTLAEDALSSVPGHLRLASLGAGATPWQTAMRVVVPTAMSGLFSAVMIGLGRAVGETMIVLMATGNTPVMSWNVFDGFRTLSANIAVELPEAVKDSTHYRTLFLAALCLFAMTFALNTVAEFVRQRFRRRAYQL